MFQRYLDVFEKHNDTGKAQKLLSKTNNILLNCLKYSNIDVIEVIIDFVLNKLPLSELQEENNTYIINSSKQNPLHCLFFNVNLTFGSKLSLYTKISPIIANKETKLWNGLDFNNNIPFNFIMNTFERVLNDNDNESNKERFTDLLTLALNNTDLTVFQNRKAGLLDYTLQQSLQDNFYQHPFGSIFNIKNPDNLKFILDVLVENKLIDVYYRDKVSYKCFLEHIVSKPLSQKWLDVLVPYLLKHVFNDNEENYITMSEVTKTKKKYDELPSQFGNLIFEFLCLPQVTSITDLQVKFIFKFINEIRNKISPGKSKSENTLHSEIQLLSNLDTLNEDIISLSKLYLFYFNLIGQMINKRKKLLI